MSITFVGPVPVPKPQTTALTVLITGASRGIGFETVRQYATADKRNVVFAAVRNPASETAKALTAFAQQHPQVHVVQLDVDDEQQIRSSVQSVSKLSDHLDLLINNAAVSGPIDPLTVTTKELTKVFNTNVAGALTVIQTYLPLLQRCKHSPKVVNISSGLGSNLLANAMGRPIAAYGVSKAALNYLTTVLRYAVPGVTFLALSPGWVATDMGKENGATPPTSAEDSVQALRYYIAEKGSSDSGNFIDICTGQIIPF